jgi:putative acetyltransferase
MTGASIRSVRPGDHAAVHAVVAAAFGGEQVADLVDALRAAGRVEVELVAVVGEEVVGHVGLERCWVDDEERLVQALVLSPLSVAPDRQGQGLGARLIAAALDAAREREEPYVFLEGAPGYYARHGFGPARDHGFDRPSSRVPWPAFQVVVLDDRGVRGRLVYPDAFWEHDAVGLRGEVLATVREQLGERRPE